MRILIADDDLVRRGVIRLLSVETDWTICGEARDKLEALQKAHELLPDVILLDLRMPGMNELDAIRRLRLELPEAKILVITHHDPVQMWPGIVEDGGDACLDKGRLGTDLVTTIKSLRRTCPVSDSAGHRSSDRSEAARPMGQATVNWTPASLKTK